MKEKTAELKEKIEKDYKDMMEVINSTNLPLFVEDTIEDMHILIKTLIAENKEVKEEIEELKENNGYHLGFIDGGIAKRYEYEYKIKAKIEIRKEEKENCKDSIEEKYLLREIYVLQSLLGKE